MIELHSAPIFEFFKFIRVVYVVLEYAHSMISTLHIYQVIVMTIEIKNIFLFFTGYTNCWKPYMPRMLSKICYSTRDLVGSKQRDDRWQVCGLELYSNELSPRNLLE